MAAIDALADVKAPNAVATIQALTKDKEREVRDAATRALAPGRKTQPIEIGSATW